MTYSLEEPVAPQIINNQVIHLSPYETRATDQSTHDEWGDDGTCPGRHHARTHTLRPQLGGDQLEGVQEHNVEGRCAQHLAHHHQHD